MHTHTFLSSRSRLGVRLIVMQMVETHMCVPYSRAEDRRLHTYSMECREAMEGFVSFWSDFLAGIQYPIICIIYAFRGSKIMEDKSCFCFFLFIHTTELWGNSAKTEMSLNFSSNRFPWAKNDYKCPFQSFFSAVTWWRAYI